MKKHLAYYISTGLLSLMMLGSVFMYLTMQPQVVHSFSSQLVEGYNALGFPSWLIVPMGILKLLGVIALWAPIPKWLREWAYGGFFFNFLLAIGAHVFNQINPNDQDWPGGFIALVLLCVSRYTLFKKES
jgi:drug/metabolite transporter superfamily protein YnfA